MTFGSITIPTANPITKRTMITTEETSLLQLARTFLKAIESGASGDELDAFYHPLIEQTVYPNSVTKQLTTRNLAHLKAGSLMGKKILASQQFEIVREYVSGSTVVLEVVWTGIAAVPLGTVQVGGSMKAWFSQFFDFEEGKIIRQRNYDCFEPQS